MHHEPIEDETWVPCDDLIDPADKDRICQEAARNGRTPSEQFSYEAMVRLGWIKPSLTH